MRPMKSWLSCSLAAVVLVAIAATLAPQNVEGGLHWREVKKGPMRVRLVALVWAHPRSSFFANQEVFIAEKEFSPGELSLVKLVYGFLPYQPRLSEYGFDYSIVHEVRAVRDPSCDETLFQMMTSDRDGSPLNFKYSPGFSALRFAEAALAPALLSHLGRRLHQGPSPAGRRAHPVIVVSGPKIQDQRGGVDARAHPCLEAARARLYY